MARKKRKRPRSRQAIRSRRNHIEALLLKAIEKAPLRGYTGMVGSKGGLFDDPRVRTLHNEYLRLP